MSVHTHDAELAEPAPVLAVLALSLVLHVVLVRVLPAAAHVVQPPPLPLVLTLAPEPVPEPPPEPVPVPAPVPAAPAAAPARASAPRATAAPQPTSEPAADDMPVDLTATRLSNAGPGIAVGSGTGGTGGGRGTGSAVAAAPPLPVGPRTVAAANLARPPRPPALDDALERHYPSDARRAGIGGRAVLRVQILPTGRVGHVERLSEAHPGFGRACEAALRSATWQPPIAQDGAAVATEITYTCRFEVRG